MNKKLLLIVLAFYAFISESQNVKHKSEAYSSSYPIIANHLCIKHFDSIPMNYVNEAAKITLMFRHASVGTTINNGLNCLQGTRNSPFICTTYPDYKYDRRNWVFEPRGNSGWYGKIRDFVKETANQIDTYEMFSFKYCYLEGLDGLAEPCGSTFNPTLVKKAWDSLRLNMEMLEQNYPDKIFIWWTIPLTQSGQFCTDTLNSLIRKYVKDNNKILFDLADIEAWDTNGFHHDSNGNEIAFKGYCGEQTPGAQACHPNWTGSVMIAKAFWWMMASIAGMQDTTNTLPTISTSLVTSIGLNSAVSGGNITDIGESNIMARGVVWSTSPNPIISLPTKTNDGTGVGNFISSLTGLDPDQMYYIKAYATNQTGTAYGNELFFTTLKTNMADLPGRRNISIFSHGKQVNFKMNTTPPNNCGYFIQDVLGRKIAEGNIQHVDTSIDLSDYPSGYYLVMIISSGDLLVKKLFIE